MDRPHNRTRADETTPPPSSRANRSGILTASAQTLYGLNTEDYAQRYKSWQDELWDYTRNVGEYGGVMDWFAAGISRMHLVAAVMRPGSQRAPEVLEDGPAAELMHQLAAYADGGETQYLYKWGRHLGVPGVGYFVGYDDRNGLRRFDVKSAKQIRRSQQPFHDERGKKIVDDDGRVATGFDMLEAENKWVQLPYQSLVGRIFRPDDEFDFEVSSWSRPALTTLRELDLLNRHIVATLLSRLVFNGILFIPEEVTFPVNEEFKDAADPFITELIAIASRGIKDPGSPASALPLPLRVPSQFIEKFRHLIIASGVDPKVIELRSSAVERLAKQLPAPPEAMEGNSSSNHWNVWKTSEEKVQTYYGPTMEILCGGMTDVYLRPMLLAANKPLEQDGGRIICWYDASDLIASPDNSDNAKDARERVIISDEAYLSALGMDEDDKATDEERRVMILTSIALAAPPAMPEAYYLLYPDDRPKPGFDANGNPLPAQPVPGSAAGKPAPNAGPSGAPNGKPAAGPAQVKQQEPPSGPPAANGKPRAAPTRAGG